VDIKPQLSLNVSVCVSDYGVLGDVMCRMCRVRQL